MLAMSLGLGLTVSTFIEIVEVKSNCATFDPTDMIIGAGGDPSAIRKVRNSTWNYESATNKVKLTIPDRIVSKPLRSKLPYVLPGGIETTQYFQLECTEPPSPTYAVPYIISWPQTVATKAELVGGHDCTQIGPNTLDCQGEFPATILVPSHMTVQPKGQENLYLPKDIVLVQNFLLTQHPQRVGPPR